MKIKLNEITVKYNPRTTFDGIEELANSIKSLGLLTPLTVAPKGQEGYILLDGQRRLLALKKLKIDEAEVFVTDLEDYQQKEVPIATDFFKDKLKISEKAIGVANLINTEKKVTAETLAKRYNFKLSDVQALLKLATLPKSILEAVDNGQVSIKQALEVTKIKREDIQIKVAGYLAGKDRETLLDALINVAFSLPFDDVFTYEQAKKDNQIGIVVKDENNNSYAFTYDKEYYEARKSEFEAREKKSYEELAKRAKKLDTGKKGQEVKETTPEQRKKKKEAAKTSLDKTLVAFRESSVSFLKNKPKAEDIATLINRFIRQISVDNSRMILKAFGVSYKASEMKSDDFRLEVGKILSGIVKDESHLAKLILFVDHLGLVYKTTLFDFDGVKKLVVKLNR
jgi:ParB/RepB/Spo0J family partition protein